MLKPGVFYRLDSVASHLAFGEHNPMNLGLAPDEVAVFWMNRLVPPLAEQREEVGPAPDRCVRAPSADPARLRPGGHRRPGADLHRARTAPRRLFRPRGRAGRTGPAPEAAARVVVQPDFSVIVIGLNPAPAAELAPFCERATRGGTPGATIWKITRESVVKAVSNGLKPSEIEARLKRHASNEVPANVLREVQRLVELGAPGHRHRR